MLYLFNDLLGHWDMVFDIDLAKKDRRGCVGKQWGAEGWSVVSGHIEVGMQ